MNNPTRKALLLLALGVSTLAASGSAAAQSPAKPSAQSGSEQDTAQPSLSDASRKSPVPQPSRQLDQNNLPAQPDQQMSLGELARLARAKKKDETKAAKVIDDENMPRGGIYIGGRAPDSSSSSAKSGGKLVLLDFWASWCGPCRESLPDLKQLQAAYGSDQLEVISISEDENERTWNSFVSQNQMTWEQRFDRQGESMRRYGAHVLPTYILLDSAGNVLQRYEGEDTRQSLAERIGTDMKKAQEPKQARQLSD